MEVKFLKEEKNEAEIQLDNLTIAEILRAYLVKDENVEFAAWKREHPMRKEIVLKVKTKGKTVKKAVSDAIEQIEKESEKLVNEFKKGKAEK
jgi:DNA-directed RNA polymerase subunit L